MKILFIACYSPIINNSAAIETLWYLNKLASLDNNEIHLLTVDYPKDSIYYDRGIFELLDKNIRVHAISGGKIFNLAVPRKKSSASKETTKDSNNDRILTYKRKIKALLAIPDAYLTWAFKAALFGKKLHFKEQFDVIFSMHEPPSSHICAYLIKRKYKNTKWITYWSDPWLKDSTREKHTKLRRYIEGTIEKKIVKISDRHIFVTKSNLKDYIDSYNLNPERCFVINRGYDENSYKKIINEPIPKLINKNRINIVYTGEIFHKLRDLTPFIEALEYLKNNNLELYKTLNILFFGNIDNKTVEERLKKQECVTVSSRIPYKEALSYMLNGDILLLFGNKNSKQIPAKIYDYFGTNALIFVVLGDMNDPIQEIVNDKDKCMVTENDYLSIYKTLISSIKSISENQKDFKPLVEYEWNNIVKKLYSIFKE